MFSYVTKDFLDLLKHYEELIEEEEVDDEEMRTYFCFVIDFDK